ncbi:MAG: polysaccharide biosynthesis/export family protein, partial [Rhodocyclaceae bacterium]|nr:polysaccharide biosynthesis/export family protein [Rhodocyclaceae bacterium]
MAVLALVALLAGGCASRFPQPGAAVPREAPSPAMHSRAISTGDVLEVAFYFRGIAETRTYRIGVGDTLRVTTSDHPDLAIAETVVAPDGGVSLPLIGVLPAVGLGLRDLAAVAEKAYAQHGLVNPRVVVAVTRSQQ